MLTMLLRSSLWREDGDDDDSQIIIHLSNIVSDVDLTMWET